MGSIESSLVCIEIDGVKFKVDKGSKIIEITDNADIYIPRFCYHKKLSISANCRMCLVEIEKAPKLAPACATPVMSGMKILTNTRKVIEAQRSVMEFLLINHPLDCPFCDQGGECELQDLTIGYGCSTSRFIEKKRVLNDYDIGPLIATDITRCILCSRCVRFCSEITGRDELGIIGRGSNSKIFTFLQQCLKSELSGNVIDLCPVGALTSKLNLNKLRAWELVQYASISFHDCIGSNLYVHVVKDEVVRVVPRRKESVNESWISDRDRFSYEGLYSGDRLKFPMVKYEGKWVDVSWRDALQCVYINICTIINKYGSGQIASFASPSSTLEEFYVLQKLLRAIGVCNLDHRLKQLDFSNQDNFPMFPGMNIDIDMLDKQDLIFLIGSNIIVEQPIASLRVRKGVNNRCDLFVLNPYDFNFYINIKEKYIVNPRFFVSVIASILKSLLQKHHDNSVDIYELMLLLNDVPFSDKYEGLVYKFLESKNKCIMLGSFIYMCPDFSKIIYLCQWLVKLTGASLNIMTDGANTAGAWISGFLPHRLPHGISTVINAGLNTMDAFIAKLKSYILFNLEVEYDSIYNATAIEALRDAEFIVSFSSFKNDILLDTADVLLPIATVYENSGTYINASGLWQSFSSVVPHKYDIKMGWKVICELAELFKVSGFIYNDSRSILKEVDFKDVVNVKKEWKPFIVKDLQSNIVKNGVIVVPMLSLYENDSLVRRATSLQGIDNIDYDKFIIKCNSKTYLKLKLKYTTIFIISGKEKIKCFIEIDDLVSDDSVILNHNHIARYKEFSFYYETISLSDK